MKGLSKRWRQYKPYGRVIENTQILAFKVPLREGANKSVPATQQCTTALLIQTFPKLKFVIDLTNTTKYYNKNEFIFKDVGYLKIMVPGHEVPSESCVLQFFKAMDTFLSTAQSDEVIGVHCTHGLNRTGYLVCRYLIQQLGWKPDDAVKAFEEARGHKIERQTYVDHLKSITAEKIDTSLIDSEPRLNFNPDKFRATCFEAIEHAPTKLCPEKPPERRWGEGSCNLSSPQVPDTMLPPPCVFFPPRNFYGEPPAQPYPHFNPQNDPRFQGPVGNAQDDPYDRPNRFATRFGPIRNFPNRHRNFRAHMFQNNFSRSRPSFSWRERRRSSQFND